MFHAPNKKSQKKNFFGRFFSSRGWLNPARYFIDISSADGHRARIGTSSTAARLFCFTRAHVANYHKKSSREFRWETQQSKKFRSFLPFTIFFVLPRRLVVRSAAGFKYETKIRKTRKCDDEIGSWNHSNGQKFHTQRREKVWVEHKISVCKTEQKISLALISSLYFEARSLFACVERRWAMTMTTMIYAARGKFRERWDGESGWLVEVCKHAIGLGTCEIPRKKVFARMPVWRLSFQVRRWVCVWRKILQAFQVYKVWIKFNWILIFEFVWFNAVFWESWRFWWQLKQ